MNNTAIDFRDAERIRQRGLLALKNELGAVGTVYFLRQFGRGQGDYTTEREALLQGITLDEIIKEAETLDASADNSGKDCRR